MTEGKKRRARNTTTAKQASRRRAKAPVEQKQVPALAMDVARNLAGGDMSRVKVQRDGSVVVVNI